MKQSVITRTTRRTFTSASLAAAGLAVSYSGQAQEAEASPAEQSIRAKSRRFGPLKLAHELRARGVDDEAIAAAFHAAGEEGVSSLEAVWRSRFSAPPTDDRERARQVRFLQVRGFAIEAILRLLRALKGPP